MHCTYSTFPVMYTYVYSDDLQLQVCAGIAEHECMVNSESKPKLHHSCRDILSAKRRLKISSLTHQSCCSEEYARVPV